MGDISLDIIQSHLSFRKESVCINGHASALQPISSKTPEGDVLAPLLFNSYIKDIVEIESVQVYYFR